MTARPALVLGSDGVVQQLQSGDGLTGYYSQTEVNALLATPPGQTVPNGIASGCGYAYSGSGLTFNMSAGTYYIDGDLYSAAQQSVTLTAADGTNPRIDVLYVDNTGTFGKITGTAGVAPSQPSVDPSTQLYLTFVLVPAAATSLSGIVNTNIYLEGSEWTATAVGTGFTVNSTNNPFAGTKCIEGTTVAAAAYVKFVNGSAISFDGDGNLALYIRSKATWATKRWLTLQWLSGGVAKGVAVSLKSGTFGFDSSSTAAYQFVVLSKSLFSIPAGTTVDELRVVDVGGSIGFYLDNIILQSTGGATSGGPSTGITQDEADARYAQRSNNLLDLTNAVTARANLGLLRLVAFFFTTAPTASEVLALYIAADAFTLAANLSGSQVSVGTNPAATFAIGVQKNGSTIATISISTGGVVTLTTTSGTSKSIAAGDVLKFVAPGSADVSIANVAVTLKGTL